MRKAKLNHTFLYKLYNYGFTETTIINIVYRMLNLEGCVTRSDPFQLVIAKAK